MTLGGTCILGWIDKFWKGHGGQIKKNACKNAYCKIGNKGCVFGHIDKFWKGHGGQIKKNACKNAYL